MPLPLVKQFGLSAFLAGASEFLRNLPAVYSNRRYLRSFIQGEIQNPENRKPAKGGLSITKYET